MGLTFNEQICIDAPKCYQSYSQAYYSSEAENIGTQTTALAYTLNQPVTVSDYGARQIVDVATGVSLSYSQFTESSIAQIHNMR